MTTLPNALVAAALASFVGGVLTRTSGPVAAGIGLAVLAGAAEMAAGLARRPSPAEVAERLLQEVYK